VPQIVTSFYYPITEIKAFDKPEGRGSCYQQFASPGPHGNGMNRFAVIFDEDIDFRIFSRLDRAFELEPEGMQRLLVVGERKGSLTFVFRGNPPEAFQTPHFMDNAIIGPDGDHWPVYAFSHSHGPEMLGHLANPELSAKAFDEAIAWSV
jgi:hypothetical protein